MKSIAALLSILALSSSTWAAQNDLVLWNALKNASATVVSQMSHEQIHIENFRCDSSIASQQADCVFEDTLANDQQGLTRKVSAEKASQLFAAAVAMGADGSSGAGRSYVEAKLIDCIQSLPDVQEGSEADRTSCIVVNNDQ